jgi:hypothetical protein
MQPNQQQQPQGGYQQPQVPYVPPAPAPQQAPFDVDEFRSQVADEIAEKLATKQAEQQQQTQQQQVAASKKYDDWGAPDQPGTVFGDVASIVEQKLQEREQRQQEVNQEVESKQKQDQQWIDNTFNELRTAGYLPPVADPLNQGDAGKQAENELLGYAISLGTTNLQQVARELKFRHDAGYKFDHNTKQFVSMKEPEQSGGPNDIFGDPGKIENPNQPAPQQPQPMQPMAPSYQQPYPQMAPAYPQPYPQMPMGPQNPYMPVPQQYPAGFNAPVSSGNSYVGNQGQQPTLNMLRSNSYDSLIETFNRTQ